MFPAYASGGGRDSSASSEFSTPGGGGRNNSYGGGGGYAPSYSSSNSYTPSPNGFAKGKKPKRKQWQPTADYQQRQAQLQQQQQERSQAESVASIRPDDEPEDVKPEIQGLGFRNDSFQKATYGSYDNTRKILEEKERKAKERKRAQFEIKKRQESSVYSVKVVNIVDSDLDSEDDAMAVRPLDEEMPSTSGPIKRHHSSSSSSSSSESDDEGRHSRRSHKHKKNKKKKGKKHRGSSSDSGSDVVHVKREAPDSDSSDGRIIGIYHIKKNPYTLLSSNDFGRWRPSYRVIHDEPDLNNVMGVPTRHRARYTLAINEVAGAPREVTEQVFGAEAAGSTRPTRYFEQPKGKVQTRPERKFRKKGYPPMGQSVIEISHQPWNSEDDESE
ncbi:hypothetical protein AAVH_35836, partial [Aphelenchoides avenae]